MNHSLFSTADLETVAPKSEKVTGKCVSKGKFGSALGKATQKVEEVIGDLHMGEHIHYASHGEWSAHDLLFHVLEQTGPAKVYISTWSASELAIQQIIDRVKSGAISGLIGVFDWRLKVRKPQVFELAKFNISDIRMTSCHAKVTVVQNDEWSVAIVGSANYTGNPRIEAGVISCDKAAADFHIGWMMAELNNSDPFDIKSAKT